MPTFQDEIAHLIERDIDDMISNLEAVPAERLWEAPPGVTNSCGVLVQHMTGNLNHYIGFALGDTGYERNRPLEFVNTGRTRASLVEDALNLKNTIPAVVRGLTEEKLKEPYPLKISYDMKIRGFLMHLYGHLQYHTGQLNYLRRILTEK